MFCKRILSDSSRCFQIYFDKTYFCQSANLIFLFSQDDMRYTFSLDSFLHWLTLTKHNCFSSIPSICLDFKTFLVSRYVFNKIIVLRSKNEISKLNLIFNKKWMSLKYYSPFHTYIIISLWIASLSFRKYNIYWMLFCL